MENNQKVLNEVASGLLKKLNAHGHAFHAALMRSAERLRIPAYDGRQSNLILDGVEVPVVHRGVNTHIDFVLRNKPGTIRFVFEAKRTDPKLSRWCFLRLPYASNSNRTLYFSGYKWKSTFDPFPRAAPYVMKPVSQDGSYDLGLELAKQNQQGEGFNARGAIQDAVSQVLRGTSGLVKLLCREPANTEAAVRGILFIPVIVTTAEIWVADADIGSADLLTGNLSSDALVTEQRKWIWLTHNRSSLLMPEIDVIEAKADWNARLSAIIADGFRTSIAVVTSAAFEEFITTDWEELFF